MPPNSALSDANKATSKEGRRDWTLSELAAAQGIEGPQRLEDLFGKGSDLWDDDADFEKFQAGLRESRRTGG